MAICVCLMVGCEQQPPTVTVQEDRSVGVSDPALTTKLGITTQEWSTILQLASTDKELVIKQASRVGKEAIDLEMKKIDDTRGDQGGPIQRVEMKAGHWMFQSNVDSWWTVPK
jgi:hypothetical protein